MAIDEAILLSAVSAEDPRPTLRLYQWSEPTLSLGYFQPYEARAQHAATSVFNGAPKGTLSLTGKR